MAKDRARAIGVEQAAKKSYRSILEEEIASGLNQIRRPTAGLLLSGLSAGLDVGFSLLLMAVMMTLSEGALSRPVTEILVANMYSIGFIFVIMGRSELFTEQTATAVMPVLHRRATLGQLGRVWGVVYVANLAGGTIFALLVALIGPALGIIRPAAVGRIAHGLLDHPGWVILLSAVLAGWLMGLLSWLVAAARDSISQFFAVWLVTTAIGLCHLHHCIAGTVEVMAGVLLLPEVSVGDYGRFLLWATLGNALGGVLFVALLKYGHVIRSPGEVPPERLDEAPPAAKKK